MNNKGIILILEDNKKLIGAICELLQDDNCIVHSARSVAEARKILLTVTPDVAVLDVMLPDGDGFDFALELRKSCPATAIIFLTAKIEREDFRAGFASGAINYIPKPFDAEMLKMAVTNVLTNIITMRTPSPESLLTEEELEAAKLVIQGMTNKDIANALFIVEASVKARLTKAYKKLGITGEDYEKRKKLAEILDKV